MWPQNVTHYFSFSSPVLGWWVLLFVTMGKIDIKSPRLWILILYGSHFIMSFFPHVSFLRLLFATWQCMDAFGKERLMVLSQVEQTMSTGVDEDGKEIKGTKLIQLLMDTLKSKIKDRKKLRILCIYIASQRNSSAEDRRQLIQASKLSGEMQEVLVNLDAISSVMNTYQVTSHL